VTQFNSSGPRILQFAQDGADPSARTQFKRKNQLAQQQTQTQQRINSGGSRTSLRDRRDLALINQGVDPQELRSGIQQSRGDLNRMMRESKRAFRNGDTATGEALRAQADRLRYDINDRFKLARPTPRDLPPEEQVARRQASRAQLNAQLPAIAEAASGAVSASQSKRVNELANIGRRAYALENGSPPPAGTSPAALAAYAEQIAGADAVESVTRGVGLPSSRGVDSAQSFRDRVQSLSDSGGVQFPAFTPQHSADSPGIVDRVRTGQIDRAVGSETGRRINGLAQRSAFAQARGDAAQSEFQANLIEQSAPQLAEQDRLSREVQLQELRGLLAPAPIETARPGDRPQRAALAEIRSANPEADPAVFEDVGNDIVAQSVKAGIDSGNPSMIANIIPTITRLELDTNMTPEAKAQIAGLILRQLSERGVTEQSGSNPGTLEAVQNIGQSPLASARTLGGATSFLGAGLNRLGAGIAGAVGADGVASDLNAGASRAAARGLQSVSSGVTTAFGPGNNRTMTNKALGDVFRRLKVLAGEA